MCRMDPIMNQSVEQAKATDLDEVSQYLNELVADPLKDTAAHYAVLVGTYLTPRNQLVYRTKTLPGGLMECTNCSSCGCTNPNS